MFNIYNICRISFEEDIARNFPDYVDDSKIPVTERRCSDTKCLQFFIFYLIFLVLTVSVAVIRGDARRFGHGYDDSGNICGLENEPVPGVNGSGLDLSESRFFEIKRLCQNDTCWMKRVCVKNCTDKPPVMFRCFPNNDIENLKDFSTIFEAVYDNITHFKATITLLGVLSIGLSSLVIVLLKSHTMLTIRIIFLLFSIEAFVTTAGSWKNWLETYIPFYSSMNPGNEISQSQGPWLFAAVTSSIFTILIFLTTVSLQSRIKLAVVLFQECGKCISSMSRLWLQSLISIFLMTSLCCLMCLSVTYIETSGKALSINGTVTYPVETSFKISRWVLTFGFFWIIQFILAFHNMVISGTIAQWYFQKKRKKLLRPVWNSYSIMINYHLGSAAFGSIVLEIARPIKIICGIFEKGWDMTEEMCLIVKCCICLQNTLTFGFKCIAPLVKFVNKNAYVMLALYGQSFRASGRRAYSFMSTSSFRSQIANMDGVGSFIFFLAEFCISSLVTFIGLIHFMTKDLQNVWLPTTLVFCFSYLCSHCFFSVYEMTMETFIMCFCVDCRINDGMLLPYFMKKPLKVFLIDDQKITSDESTSDENGDYLSSGR